MKPLSFKHIFSWNRVLNYTAKRHERLHKCYLWSRMETWWIERSWWAMDKSGNWVYSNRKNSFRDIFFSFLKEYLKIFRYQIVQWWSAVFRQVLARYPITVCLTFLTNSSIKNLDRMMFSCLFSITQKHLIKQNKKTSSISIDSKTLGSRDHFQYGRFIANKRYYNFIIHGIQKTSL